MHIRSLWFVSAAACAIAGTSVSVSAQEIGSTAGGVLGDDSEYRHQPVPFGPFNIEVGAEAQLEYDDNIFAEPTATESDVIARFRPYAGIEHRTGALRTTLSTKFDLRRYFDFTSENATGASALLTSSYSPQAGEAFTLTALADRAIEDRGDPEAREIEGIGPRIYRILGGSAGYTRQGSRFLVEAVGDYRNVDALAIIDAQRDYETYSGRVTVGYRSGGPFYLTGTGYYTRRNFRLREPITNIDRDTSTVGALAGIRFDDGGLIEGRVGAGIFKLSTDDPLRDGRTGFSLQGQLAYRPTQRTAVRLNLFNGDVASFRSGGSTRTETNIGLFVEQEIRHNFLGSAGVEFERYNFSGSNSPTQQRWRATTGLEYLINRRLSVFGRVSYSDRSSDGPLEGYSRFRAGAGVRVRL
ncbi:outer membrane beta-barrel protein [Aurantiacibacter rhizosphaerae]|uniref:Outer membrane beta-barrel protein n=1 Tax=Aurantiacibacter rhizosphaerae TaxID=2691582 RepID=A0A844XC76_9SPHN|nr:outer membrane beta-barrel protein [Aurantiacibacter rhizosphaerae]MWV27586.1 outer membrane beta-barrel protein [Aurantiacibacter rhizosphaerae]